MEYALYIVVILLFVAFFKKPIKRISAHTNDVITVNIQEDKVELYERAKIAKDTLIERCGENYQTVEEIYNETTKRTPKKS